jgi:DNA polymerase III subunit alpha
LVRGRVQQRQWSKDPNEIEFKISAIEMLSEVRAKLAKSLTISLDLNQLDNQLLNDLTEVISQSQGGCKLNFVVHDRNSNMAVEMPSKDKGVELSDEFIESLNKLPQIKYRLN